jgi:hypothetical protein
VVQPMFKIEAAAWWPKTIGSARAVMYSTGARRVVKTSIFQREATIHPRVPAPGRNGSGPVLAIFLAKVAVRLQYNFIPLSAAVGAPEDFGWGHGGVILGISDQGSAP